MKKYNEKIPKKLLFNITRDVKKFKSDIASKLTQSNNKYIVNKLHQIISSYNVLIFI